MIPAQLRDPANARAFELRLAAADEIIDERFRQTSEENHSLADDDAYTQAELSRAAASFALLAGASVATLPHDVRKSAAEVWPFAPEQLREKRSPRRMLVIAGALILAEIERLERQTKLKGEE